MRTAKNLLISALSLLILTCSLVNCSKDVYNMPEAGNSGEMNLKSGTLNATITSPFSRWGYTWNIKSGSGMGPGNNTWNAGNVWVEADGIHLQIKYNKDTGKWECAEVWTSEKLGFGTYEWEVKGEIDQYNEDVVLGLFNYLPTTIQGAKKTAEIDIEFSKWGKASQTKIGSYTVWPNKTNLKPWTSLFDMLPTNGSPIITTHRFTWSSKGVYFQSVDASGNEFASTTYTPSKPTQYIPQIAEPVHINLWVFEGGIKMADKTKTYEVLISNFTKL